MRGATHAAHKDHLLHRNFNPRTPCGVRLRIIPVISDFQGISIHAPRAGCDQRVPFRLRETPDFNPRTPCGVRHHHGGFTGGAAIFQSTHPVRGATGTCKCPGGYSLFQSTHPVRGATSMCAISLGPTQHFNPRTPCGVRLVWKQLGSRTSVFQSTHPVRGATTEVDFAVLVGGISIHAPRAGCDCRRSPMMPSPPVFQSTHPVRGATMV